MVANTQNIAILILAAGSSSRMGRPKQLLSWKGTTLLGNAIQNALAANAKSVFVVLGANAEAIRNEILVDEIEIIENTNWESGLGSSIVAGMTHLLKNGHDFDGILIMLADQPLIDTDYLNLMITSFYNVPENIVATAYNNRAGVPALFDYIYFSELTGLKKDFGAKEIIGHKKDQVFEIEPKNKTLDIDTERQYQDLIKKLN